MTDSSHSSHLTSPDVSVIVGAYNAMPYFEECMRSILEQTIGHSRMEVIVVDDGSTDGTGEYADSLALEHSDVMTVIHQANSGGPAGPRNVGLGHARGRYVYFVDADDYIGTDALSCLVETADAEGSDVLLGKMVGVGGRGVPASMYHHTVLDVDLFTSRVYWTLAALKLFRRSLLEEHHIRFDETLKTGEDQPFTALAYLKAKKISTLADDDYYFARRRDDGQNTTKQLKDLEPRIQLFLTMMDLVGRQVPAGSGRDHLMRRHLQVEFLAYLNAAARREPDLRNEYFERFRTSIVTWVSDDLERSLVSAVRLQLHLLRAGQFDRLGSFLTQLQDRRKKHRYGAPRWHHLPPTRYHVRGPRCYAEYPFFEDEEADLPLELFDVTEELPASFGLRTLGFDRFEIEVVGEPPVSSAVLTSGASQTVDALGSIKVDSVACSVHPQPSLTLRGHATQMTPGQAWSVMVAQPGGTTVVRIVPGEEDGGFTASIPILGEGVHSVYFVAGGGTTGIRVPVKTPTHEPVVAHGFRRARPWFTQAEAHGEALRIRSGRRHIMRGLRRRLGR